METLVSKEKLVKALKLPLPFHERMDFKYLMLVNFVFLC